MTRRPPPKMHRDGPARPPRDPSRPRSARIAAALAVVLALAAAPAPVAQVDIRIPLHELQLAGRTEQALEVAESEILNHPERARRLGLHYLRGHLLAELGRHREARDAFTTAMGTHPGLALHSRYRLALENVRLGHPEVAAGLVSTVVAQAAPESELLRNASRLLAEAVDAGGDCRQVELLSLDRLPDGSRRRLERARADCLLREDRRGDALSGYLALLAEEDEHDEAEREAAERIARHFPDRVDRALATRIGLAFHQHRTFDRALEYLERVVREMRPPLSEKEFAVAYQWARAQFWQERFDVAAESYAWLARSTPDSELEARSRYQQGRSLELHGEWGEAAEVYRAAYRADPETRWAGAAVLGRMRLLWRAGEEEEALGLYDLMRGEDEWDDMTARAALFLAASDLVRKRADRAGAWLDQAEDLEPAVEIVADYWRGRLAELEGDTGAALDSYLAVLREDAFHPLSVAARGRFAGELGEAARTRGRRLAESRRPAELYTAWLLLGDGDTAGARALATLRERRAGDREAGPYVTSARVRVADWPLWGSLLDSPEETLLALGVWAAGASAVPDHFPLTDPALTVTSSHGLGRAGKHHAAVLRAELLAKRAPDRLPEVLLSETHRRWLYPLVHPEILRKSAREAGIDPLLLASIMREESRFDARALSPASARGLTQFIQPTADRLAAATGLGEIDPEDLYRPEVAIQLGAAYLAELAGRFRGDAEAIVAAYNAGPSQARVWRSYCFSLEPEEFYTKVSFRETRGYLSRVLGSWSRYRELYDELDPATAELFDATIAPKPARPLPR